MKISTEIHSAAKLVGIEKAIELCAAAGFDAWDFSMFDMHKVDWKTGLPVQGEKPMHPEYYLEFAQKLGKIGRDNGIFCNQSHAPFPTQKVAVRNHLELAIECTAAAGGKICVIHPDPFKSAAENAQTYKALLPLAKKCGVKIATENMWDWDKEKDESTFAACATGEDFQKHLDAVNDEFFVACLDIGHAEMRGSGDGAVNMIRLLGPRLQALHIHDNDRHHDNHQIPFSMGIDFDAIVQALKEVDYKGEFTLEANAFFNGYTALTTADALQKLQDSVRTLADKFEKL